MKRVLFTFLFTVTCSLSVLAAQFNIQQSFEEEIVSYLKGQKILPVSKNSVLTDSPIPIQNPDLVSVSNEGSIILSIIIDLDIIHYYFYDFDGEPLGNFEKNWTNDIPLPNTLIDGHKKRIYLIDLFGNISCHDFRGRTYWELKQRESFNISYENSCISRMSADGKEFIVGWGTPAAQEGSSFLSTVLRIDYRGWKKYRKEVESSHLLGLSVNTDLSGVALLLREKGRVQTHILDKKGRTLSILDEQFRDVHFLSGNRIVLLTKNQIKAYNYLHGSLEWLQPPLSSENIYDSFLVNGNELVTIHGVPYYNSGHLLYRDARITYMDLQGGVKDSVPLATDHYISKSLFLSRGHIYLGSSSQLYSSVKEPLLR